MRVVDARVAAGPPGTPPVGRSAPAGMRALYWAAAAGNSRTEAAARWAADKLRTRLGQQSNMSVIAHARANVRLVHLELHWAGIGSPVA